MTFKQVLRIYFIHGSPKPHGSITNSSTLAEKGFENSKCNQFDSIGFSI